MKVLITGADGFVGKNLGTFLSENKSIEIVKFTRKNNENDLLNILPSIEFIFHLAGVNRPKNEVEFKLPSKKEIYLYGRVIICRILRHNFCIL